MEYSTRIIDQEIAAVQPHVPALVLQGAKAVGKTATASRLAVTILRMDREVDRTLLQADPSRLSTLPGPVLVDEWQLFPTVWDLVRQVVDADGSTGRFLMAGSATPRHAPVHSGAGRMVTLRMRPLSLAERGLDQMTVSLSTLLDGTVGTVGGTTAADLGAYTEEIVASGFPGLRGLPHRARRAALRSYLDAVVLREFPEQGLAVRRPETLRGWMRAYAAASATTASYGAILDAATPGQVDKPARSTTTAYRDVLDQLWLLDPLPAWLPQGNHFSRLARLPKHFLADPALAVSLLDLTADSLLRGGPDSHGEVRRQPFLGAMFEHLVAQSVLVYAQACEARVSHFRALDGGREIDLIVERGRDVVALEVKLAAEVSSSDVRHLLWLRERLGDRFRAGVIVTTGRFAYRRDDGLLVVPASLLGP